VAAEAVTARNAERSKARNSFFMDTSERGMD